MSLKAFHIFFIAMSTLFALGLGTWSIGEYRRVDGTENLILAVGSFVLAATMCWYGQWFLRKLRGLRE